MDNIPSADINLDRTVNDLDIVDLIENVLGTRFGDDNLDGRADNIDCQELATNFGTPTTGWSYGDFDGDGNVYFGDFVILSNNFR